MRADDLKNWLAVLGIGGGVALGAGDAPATAARGPGPEAKEEPFEVREREPLYVVINHEEQYSIWPSREAVPREWRRLTDPLELRDAVGRYRGDDELRYRVVINHEEQYSIWPKDRDLPEGFRLLPKRGDEEPCQIKVCAQRLEEHRERSR